MVKNQEVDLEVQERIKEGVVNIENTNKILKQTDLYEILPFKETKVKQLIKSGQLPLVKIGKDYITTFSILEDWIRENIGEEIFF